METRSSMTRKSEGRRNAKQRAMVQAKAKSYLSRCKSKSISKPKSSRKGESSRRSERNVDPRRWGLVLAVLLSLFGFAVFEKHGIGPMHGFERLIARLIMRL